MDYVVTSGEQCDTGLLGDTYCTDACQLHSMAMCRSLPVFLHWIPTFNIHLCNKNGGGHQGTLDYTMTMWKQCSRDGQPFGCAVLFPLLRITLPSFPSLSPPSHHCPLLPITVPSFPSLSPSFPSLSPPSSPSHHCPLCPLLPITVPSSPSLSPPSHHCPLLPITVPSFPSLSPSFPSLSPPSSPSHHCPLCPLLPITVPSSPSLSPPSHHCPLLPITVPSSPSLSPPPHHCPLLPITSCYHGRLFFPTTLKIFPPPPNLVS
ncbi:hypothetical protein EMCRGX_G025660 [Ephydatia muelleri]